MQLIIGALNDPYDKLRIKALNALQDTTVDAATVKTIENIANTDNKKIVRAEAIDFLGQLKDTKYTKMFINAARDSSYSVAGAALDALIEQDADAALKLVPELKKDAKGRLKSAVEKADILTKTDADFDTIYKKYESSGLMEKFNDFGNFSFYVGRLNDTEKFKKGIDQLVKFRDMVAPYGQGIKEVLNKSILNIKKMKEAQKGKSVNSSDIENKINYILEKTQD
jgi:aminopeptidase N